METLSFEITLRGTLRAYNQEDGQDQVKRFLGQLGGFDGYIHALEPLGIRFNYHDLVMTGISGMTGQHTVSARKCLITRAELLALLKEQHQRHPLPAWHFSHKSKVDVDDHNVLLRAALADIDHQQWEHWSRGIAEVLEQAITMLRPTLVERLRFGTGLEERLAFVKQLEERLERWKALWETPYLNLTAEQQQDDLLWADKSMEALLHHLTEGWPT